jgi:exonuclease VII large subunit
VNKLHLIRILNRLLLFISFVFIIFYFAIGQPNYSVDEAVNHIGEKALVEGEVAQVSIAQNGNIYVSMGNKFPNAKFAAVILSIYSNLFPKAEELEGKRIRVYGVIENDMGSIQIIVRSKSQIKIVR